MTGAPRIHVERDGALTILTIDAPPVNLFDLDLIAELEAAVAAIARSEPRAVLLRAAGRVVSGGMDVNVFTALDEASARELSGRLLGIAQAVEALPVPTVFAAHARCLTAAFELALGCDLLLAAESADFGLVEARVAVSPGMGGTQRLVTRAGPMRAAQIVMTGALFDAATLERWNVVTAVLPDEGFASAARDFTLGLAEGPTVAHRATKRLIRAAVDEGRAGADALTPAVTAPLYETGDVRRAVAAFLEEGTYEPPVFEGR